MRYFVLALLAVALPAYAAVLVVVESANCSEHYAECATIKINSSTGDDSYTYAQVTGDPDTYKWATLDRATIGCTLSEGSCPTPVTRANWDSTEAAQAGDIVEVEAGTNGIYQGLAIYDDGPTSSYQSYRWKATFAPVNSGSVGNRIVFRSAVPRAVTLRASTFTTANIQAHPVVGNNWRNTNGDAGTSDYITWDGFIIDRTTNQTDTSTWTLPGEYGAVVFYDSGYDGTSYTIQNSEIYVPFCDTSVGGTNYETVYIEGVDKVSLINNKIHGALQPGTGNSGCVLTYGGHSHLIEYNTIYDCDSGITWKDEKSATYGNTIRFNYVYDVVKTPIAILETNQADMPSYSDIYQNVFTKTRTGLAIGADVNREVKATKNNVYDGINKVRFVNNTWYISSAVLQSANVTDFLQLNANTGYISDVQFYNNIFFTKFPKALDSAYSTANEQNELDYNNYYHIDGTTKDWVTTTQTYSGLAAWQAAYTYDQNSFDTDPSLVDAGSADYRLNDGNNGIGTGQSSMLSAGYDLLNLLGGGVGESINVGAYISSDQSEQIGADW